MSDDKNIRGQQDRDRVSGNEDYEVQYLVDKLGVSADMVKLAIKEVGNSREAVEKFLREMKSIK